MTNFKNIIANKIAEVTNLDVSEIEGYIEMPPNSEMGDYAFPCFKLAKSLRKAPQMIAEELKEKLEFEDGVIENTVVVGGYLNFYVSSSKLIQTVLTEIDAKKENYGSSTVGNGKNIVIDYSSPNIAKPFHIGHLRSTVIGSALYKMYKFLGYNCTGVNHLGDYRNSIWKID